jgi:hypothetical protein
MTGVVKMFGGMLVLRRIAAADMPAGQAHAQVNPGVAHFDAVRTNMYVCGRDFDLIEMLAFCHYQSPLDSVILSEGWASRTRRPTAVEGSLYAGIAVNLARRFHLGALSSNRP